MNKQLLQQAAEALEIARTGLQWYRGMMPEYVDGSDGEADEEIQAALNALESALQQQPEPVAPDLAKRLQQFRKEHWTHWTADENQLVVDCFHALRTTPPALQQQEPS